MEYNFWIFYLGGLIVSLLGQKIKQKRFAGWIVFACVFFILSSCVPSSMIWGDLNNYATSYARIEDFYPIELGNEWAFYNFFFLCKKFGMTFMQCKAWMMLIAFILVFRSYEKYAGEEGTLFALFFYMLHMIFNFAYILRNSLGFAILMVGMQRLLDRNSRYRTIQYILAVLIAAQFHSMMYLYLPLVIINISVDTIKKYRKLFVLILIVAVASLIVFVRSGILISTIAVFVGRWLQTDKYSSYAVVRGHYAWLSVFFIWLATVINVFIVAEKIKRNGEERKNAEIKHICYAIEGGVLKRIYRITNAEMYMERFKLLLLISSVYAPLCIFSLHFGRYLKYMSLMNLLYMAMAYAQLRGQGRERVYVFASTLVITLLWLYFDMFIYGGYDPEMLQLYFVEGNWFWN